MANCYFCGCNIRSGEGYRRKVLTSESTRIYITKSGGGSYGQTYSLRTLCIDCVRQLDDRSRNLSWQLPVSIVMGLVGVVMAVRWAVADHSPTSALGSLVYAFFLFGGLGFLTYFILNIFSGNNTNESHDSVTLKNEVAENIQESTFQGERNEEFSDYKESILQLAITLGDIGISLQGIYGFPQTLEGFISVNDQVLKTIPPKHYSSKDEWEKHLKKRVYSKFSSIASSEIVDAKLLAFPPLEDEDEESYSARLSSALTKSATEIK